jgi:nicotinate-nucleotide pyrophosphorylase (carboxylating)
MYHEHLTQWKALLRTGLEDDGWEWDWTSRGVGMRKAGLVRARIVAKSPGIWAAAGLPRATELLAQELGGAVKLTGAPDAGAALRRGEVVCRWRGPAPLVLALERPFLNLASYAGGIALRTRGLVARVGRRWKQVGPKGAPAPRVTSTRKTLPGYRDVAIAAVIAGGGHPHRVSLAGGVLIKENHVSAAGGIARAIRGARAAAPHGLKIEIEVRDERELAEALRERAEVVMLDNFTPEAAASALRRVARVDSTVRPLIEISGGVNEENIERYVLPGVDVISVGSLTHSVMAIDLSLLVE